MQSSKPSILLAEDEENLHEALKLNLELEGYEVTSAYTGSATLQKVQQEYFDLLILDVMLPDIDGISITETIRVQNNDVPILILSAKNTGADRVLGLKKGADDYLTKPFNLEELLLRVQKLIRKNQKLNEKDTVGDTYQFGNNTIDFPPPPQQERSDAAETTDRKQERRRSPRKDPPDRVGLQCISHHPHHRQFHSQLPQILRARQPQPAVLPFSARRRLQVYRMK